MDETVRLRLRVSPGAARSEIVGRHGEGWKVRVAAAPERGRANEAVIRLLTDALRVEPGRLALVSGGASRDKVVEVRGLDAAEAERRLERSR
jgi:uncharacterized protein (TIGR00251 family)